ncbi:hypothetical protein F511_26817 [Dorcoceras hygrometricum]|uniref:Uncharacterized protein n=1 Tax=Dorcoceras hygrometricum TaxID=472368 RepID=A0A2Z7AHF3_9LAMI|nr:hypothetical protein F511_26817 [Dorcoceras hygrometricum]
MIIDSIGIFELKGSYCTLTMTDWFLQALPVIPRGSWGDVARHFTMNRWCKPTKELRFHTWTELGVDPAVQPLKGQFPPGTGRSQASRCRKVRQQCRCAAAVAARRRRRWNSFRPFRRDDWSCATVEVLLPHITGIVGAGCIVARGSTNFKLPLHHGSGIRIRLCSNTDRERALRSARADHCTICFVEAI